EAAFGLKTSDPLADRIFTVMDRAFLRGFLALVAALAAFLVASSPAPAASRPKVLVVHFGPDLEINPVTKDWVNHQLGAAEHSGPQAQHDVAGARGDEGVEPHRAAGPSDERDRRDRAVVAGPPAPARRLPHEGR